MKVRAKAEQNVKTRKYLGNGDFALGLKKELDEKQKKKKLIKDGSKKRVSSGQGIIPKNKT